jgi:hypothetical protein
VPWSEDNEPCWRGGCDSGVKPKKKYAKSERAGMGVDTAGCLDLVVILSHTKVEPMPSSINAWCVLRTHKRCGGWLSRPRRLSVGEEEDIAAADAGTTRSKLWTRLQKSERVCGESG